MTLAIIITAINVILSGVNICIAFRIRNKVRNNNEFIERLHRKNTNAFCEILNLRYKARQLELVLKNNLYNGAFSKWTFVRDTEGKRDFYLEKDGIRLIFDDKKCIGWYKPNTYEAPSAEVVN